MKERKRSLSIPVLLLAVGAALAAVLWVWLLFIAPDSYWDISADVPGAVTGELPPAASPETAGDETELPGARQPEEPAGEPETAPAGPEPPSSATTPSIVSLRTVDVINSRPRALEAVSTEVRAETWEMWGVMSFHKNLTYVNTQLGDIPLLEAFRDDGSVKPLLLFLHGLGEDKETVIETLSAFAEAGYHAVGVDAFDQGDRLARYSSVDTWAAMLITVADIDPILEYYQTVETVDTAQFVLGGFSMGAVEATAYLELGSYKPAALLAFCGLCQYDAWQVWQRDSLAYGWLSSWWDTVWSFPEWQTADYTGEKYQSILSMNISSNLESFSDIPLLCCVGTLDQFFNAGRIRRVVNLITNSGNANAKCIVYPFGTHQITGRMLTDALAFLGDNASP